MERVIIIFGSGYAFMKLHGKVPFLLLYCAFFYLKTLPFPNPSWNTGQGSNMIFYSLTIARSPGEVLKPEDEAWGFQLLPRDLADVSE